MDRVPNSTTVATATALLWGAARNVGSNASTAAAPQIALPAAVSMAVSRSRPSTRWPTTVPIRRVPSTTATETAKPGRPTAAICWMLIFRP
ncbi:hypothetical protein D3C72_2174110 [compost metagenome]